MRQAKTIQIDDRTYLIGHWPPDQATEILAWLTVTFGPIFSQVFSGNDMEALKNKENDSQVIVGLVETASKMLIKVVEPKKYAEMIRTMTKDLLVDGQPCNFNFHFQGRIFHLHKVIFEVLKFQYADFLEGAQGLLGG